MAECTDARCRYFEVRHDRGDLCPDPIILPERRRRPIPPPKRFRLEGAPTTLYRMYDHDGNLVYVGITSRMNGTRFAQHDRDKSWWQSVSRIDLEHFATRQEALDAERVAIQTERPMRNVCHNR